MALERTSSAFDRLSSSVAGAGALGKRSDSSGGDDDDDDMEDDSIGSGGGGSGGSGGARRLRLNARSRRLARTIIFNLERCVRVVLTRAIFAALLCAASLSSFRSFAAACRRAATYAWRQALPHRWPILLFAVGAVAGGLLVEETERPCSHARDVPLLVGAAMGLKRSLLLPFGGSAEDELLQPRIVAPPEAEGDGAAVGQPKVKYTRPEFLRTELGVRDKVLVCVLVSRESAARLALPLSRMLASRALPVVVFAKSADYAAMPAELEAVKIDLSEQSTWEFPLRAIAHVRDHYADKYDFYYFLPDTVYVRGEKFADFVSRIPITTELYAGVPASNDFCDFDAGVVFSKSVIEQVAAQLSNCTQLATASYTKTIGLCVAHSVDLKCTTSAETLNYATFILQTPASRLTVETLNNQFGLNDSLIVYPVVTPEAFYRLHEYFTIVEIETLKNEIKDAEVEAWRTKLLPLADPSAEIIWPIGTRPQTRPEKRFDIKRWDYFDMTGIYYDNEFINVRPLTGADRLDILEVVEKAQEVITKKYPDTFTFLRLANGYRKLDPNRGMMYLVDLELRENKGYKKMLKRVELLRPISTMEVIGMPSGVASKTVLRLVLPVSADTSYEHWRTFLHKFETEIAAAKYEADLVVAFLYGDTEYAALTAAKKADVYQSLKNELRALKPSSAVATTVDVLASSVSSAQRQLQVMVAVAKKLPESSVVMIASVEVDLSVELLDRIKANTVKGRQVYSPVGFWQYLPELVYNDTTHGVPDLEINRDYGRFETNSYEHISFHMSDYVDSLSVTATDSESAGSANASDVYEVFLAARRVHIMRAVEPALKLRHRDVTCDDHSDPSRDHYCRKVRQANLASKAKMALIYFKDKGLV